VASDVKDNKKGFFKYISSKWKTRDNMGPLLNEVAALVIEDTESYRMPSFLRSSVLRLALRHPRPWR